MQDFLKRLKTKVKGIESMHRCGDILIKEDIKTGECEVYSKEENKRKRKSISITDVEITIPNIEDSADCVSYRIKGLPGGRTRVINPSNEFILHSLQDICYGLSGKEVSLSEMLDESTIQEYVKRYQEQREQMRYIQLAKAKYNGQTVYVGRTEAGYEDLSRGTLLKVSDEELEEIVIQGEAITRYLYDFGSLKSSYVGFTRTAVQNIIQKDKEREETK